ncbi:EVE domain-containing protein [Altererythrobacter salegens]|uniref:EVE domain-containing protein n=1 Tax=Croceibacterium salegens TaxID=1737568 RepID=A0A6I4SYL3_9SPHN|nr:EVE domain-containing protein [Croceibacterium salegens]MXO59382.1 EVE domain-containing protein [Croceibacterium salegens]
MAKRLWLMKSEPEAYSFDRLVKEGRTIWDGVRNYRARNNLQAMQVGDEAFFYHSVSDKEIVGIVRIVAAGLADPKDDTGTWAAVEIEPVRKLAHPVSLAAIKAEPSLAEVELLKLSRLSVAEIRPDEWKKICAMAGG